jgi:glyoxylase-like metal-dependent hydrolase (beta-lactamase superfamily II)
MGEVVGRLVVGPLQTNAYLLWEKGEDEAMVIDPGAEAENILLALESRNLSLGYILATHGHFDHIGAGRKLQEETGAPFALHRRDLFLLEGAERQGALFGVEIGPPPEVDIPLRGGEKIGVGGLLGKVLPTPGHTPGSVSYHLRERAFVGDLLFAGSVGRTDLEGGSQEALLNSLTTVILLLGDGTLVHPGHGPETTVGRERHTNPFLLHAVQER